MTVSYSSQLVSRLREYGRDDNDYWSFRGNAVRHYTHAYFQYPAMMVPQMQADLLQAATSDDPTIRRVYDPFVGAGTALIEAMKLGLDFVGRDINPLAVLLCRAKTIPPICKPLHRKVRRVLEIATHDRGRAVEADFPNLHKWFRRDVSIKLSRIRRAIRCEPSRHARRFLWVAMAETVRQCSNSRTSTFKLHIRAADELAQRRPCPLRVFENVCSQNLVRLEEQRSFLESQGLLSSGKYIGRTAVSLGAAGDMGFRSQHREEFDLLLTSPPYGDNASTIPYGQHSYLPLQWIDLVDIDPKLDSTCLSSTHEIDAQSLGGCRRLKETDVVELLAMSASLAGITRRLNGQPPDRRKRLLAFCRDMNQCIDPILDTLRPGAHMIWIVGNRNVGGLSFPFDNILTELFSARGVRHLSTINRSIPTKRTALRNNISRTMRRESILVMQKPS